MDVVFKKDVNKANPLLDKIKGLFKHLKNIKVPNNIYYFLVLLVVGFGFYFYMLIENGWTLAYGGDYSAQYIPMGYHVWDYFHEWLQTGHFTLFDSTLYLGVNSYGSNAYYGLFSPFNIIVVLLPRQFVPHSLAITSIIKLACAGLFFSVYMRRAFKVKEKVAYICGIAYAFSGWGAFYLWYNNYQDILVFFPLVLLGIEKTIQEEKPWILSAGVFFLAICNYVLMVPYLICAFLYAMFRFFQNAKNKTFIENLRILGFGVIGFAGGLLMSLFVVGPAILATLSSPKLDIKSYGDMLKQYINEKDYNSFFKLLFSWTVAADQHQRVFPSRVYYPILEFFVPATTCRSTPSLEIHGWDFDDFAVSLWCYVPIIMFLVPALIQSGKEKKWSHYIGFALLTLSLFTPFMYFLTMGFTNGYARWTLFIVSSVIAYVGIYIDKIPNVARWHIHLGALFAILGVVASWILTWKLYNPAPGQYDYKSYVHRFVEYYDTYSFDYTNIVFLVELGYIVLVYIALFFTYYKKAFHILATVFVAAESVAVGTFVSIGHGWDTSYNNGYAYNAEFKQVLDKVKKADSSYYRIYSSIGDAYSTNNSLMNNYRSVSFFHSLYNFEIDDFTMWTGLRSGTRSVAGDYRGKYQDLDNLLGVKYYFISKRKSKQNFIDYYYHGSYNANVPFDFDRNEAYENNDDFMVYENKDLPDFALSYDSLNTGKLRNDGNVRIEITAIKNTIALSTSAFVSEEDSQELLNFDISGTIPEITSVKQIKNGTDFKKEVYDLRAFLDDYWQTHKKKYRYEAYEYPFQDIASIPETFTPSTYDSKKTTDYFAFYSSKTEGEPLFKEDTTFYFVAPFDNDKKYDVYFIDKDNNIFMYDCHDDNTTNNTCYVRAFYIRKDVYRMAIAGKWSQSYLDDSTLSYYVEDRAAYNARKELLLSNPVKNVISSPDKFTFDTDYDQTRFVVTRVAYDKGWSIKAKDSNGHLSDVKVYKGNGGFVSFVAPAGNYSYSMTYQTPYLAGSATISCVATASFFVSMLGYYLYSEKKKVHYIDKIHREN